MARDMWEIYDMTTGKAQSQPATKTATQAELARIVDEWRGRGDGFTARKDYQITHYVETMRPRPGTSWKMETIKAPVKDGEVIRHFKRRGVWVRSLSIRVASTKEQAAAPQEDAHGCSA